MRQTRPSTEPSGWTALVLTTITTAAFTLLALYGPGLHGVEFGLFDPPYDFGWLFDALAWLSATAAPWLAWAFGAFALLLLAMAGFTKGFRSGPRPGSPFVTSAILVPLCPLLLVTLPPAGACVFWLVLWFVSGFGECLDNACTPAVP